MNEMRVVGDPTAKIGHASPCCGETNQLFVGDHGLTCPKCNTVYVPPAPKKEKAKPEK